MHQRTQGECRRCIIGWLQIINKWAQRCEEQRGWVGVEHIHTNHWARGTVDKAHSTARRGEHTSTETRTTQSTQQQSQRTSNRWVLLSENGNQCYHYKGGEEGGVGADTRASTEARWGVNAKRIVDDWLPRPTLGPNAIAIDATGERQ